MREKKWRSATGVPPEVQGGHSEAERQERAYRELGAELRVGIRRAKNRFGCHRIGKFTEVVFVLQ